MGMFDSVMVPCPSCLKREEFQSKSGPCLLQQHDLEYCPQEILDGLECSSAAVCDNCGTRFRVVLIKQGVSVRMPIENTHNESK